MERPPKILEIAMEMALPHEFLTKVSQKFSPESAREVAMSTSVGGIGPLLRERVFGQAEAGVDVVGVSLMYESVWVQAWHEWGQINLQKRRVGGMLRQSMTSTNLSFSLTFFDGTKADVTVWELNYGGAKVYFLDCPAIAEVVYPGPKDFPPGSANPYALSHEARLKQSWLVGRGALVLSQHLNRTPDIIVLSETPTIFGHHRLVKDDLQQDKFFADTRYIFNDHTPLEYAHPIWDQGTLDMVKLDPALYNNTPAWNAQKKTLDITSLLVSGCEGVYGVAKKHGEVMKAMPSLKEFAPKIQYVTNGVRRQDWQVGEFKKADSMPDEEILNVKKKYKAALVDWIWRNCRLWPAWAQEAAKKNIVVWTRRITPYKRLDILVKMLKNADMKKQFLSLNLIVVVGGRIHQQDNHAQDIMYELLDLLEKDENLSARIIIVTNFNVWDAPFLFQGADGAMMIADDTREASATGFMKGQMNGAAIIATNDGAVPEFVHFEGQAPAETVNGFLVPYVNGEPTPVGLLDAFTAFDNAYKDPARVAKIVRQALNVTKDVDVARTVEEVAQLYSQVCKKTTSAAR